MIGRREVMAAAAAAAGVLPFGKALAADGKPAVVSRIALVDGRILMAAKIGATGPYLFMIDTGGVLSLIENDLAQRLHLKEVRGQTLRGVGGVSDAPWYNGGELTLAIGVHLPEMLFAGTGAKFGPDIVGTFGTGLLTSFDSDLDLTKNEWRAWPGGRPDRDGYVALPSRFTGRLNSPSHIVADVDLDGFGTEVLVDTGAPGGLTLDSAATGRARLWNDARPYAPMLARGIGKGQVPTRLVRAGKLTVGKFSFNHPLVQINRPGSGATSRYNGTLGMGVLMRLNLSTEVGAGKLWASPSGLVPPPRTYPRSGLWVEADGERVVAADVGTGSPAAAAGIAIGDTFPGMRMGDLVREISGPAGKAVTVKVERGGTTRDVAFTLADYL